MNNLALLLTTAAAATLAASPAAAQNAAPAAASSAGAKAAAVAPSLAAGVTVYDPKGGVVGTIESLDGDAAVLATAANKVRLPTASFGTGPRGPTLAMTAAQVDAMVAATPPPALNLVKGGSVTDASGKLVGTIEEVTPQFVLVATTRNKVQLPVSAFAGSERGPVIGMTAVELDAAADAAKAQTAAASAPAKN